MSTTRTIAAALIALAGATDSPAQMVMPMGYAHVEPPAFNVIAPGSTVYGSYMRSVGVGMYGLGRSNYDTARAMAVRQAMQMQLNEYLFQARQAQASRHDARRDRRGRLLREHRSEIEDRKRYRPNEADIRTGDALNVLLRDLSGSSLYRAVPEGDRAIQAEVIRSLPLQYAAAGESLSLAEATTHGLPDRFESEVALRSPAALDLFLRDLRDDDQVRLAELIAFLHGFRLQVDASRTPEQAEASARLLGPLTELADAVDPGRDEVRGRMARR